MSKILKSVQFNKNTKSKGKGGAKKGNNSKSAEAKPQHKSQGPAVSAAGPFTGGKPPIQCHRCMGWGHFMRNCPNREPIQGSVEWGNLHGEVALEGAPFSPGEGASPKPTITSKAMGGRGSEVNIVPGPQYHNPDPLVRLIGTSNESRVEVEGVPITALIDSGANLSAITKSFAEELQLEIKGLQTILDIEPTGGGWVPYHGYVECKLKIPQIKKFDLDILMLVIDDSPYAMRVPIQIGTLHIDMALNLATEEERKKLNCQWRRAKLASSLRMKSANANVEGSEEPKNVFDLDNVTGLVQITKDLQLQPFENVTISGLLKGPVKCSAYFK